MSESGVTSRVRLAAAQMGIDLWRNQSGAFQDATGRWIRFGLANDSKALNERIKSSDFIGITPVVITQDMVGKTVGVFTAVEIKDEDWVYRESDARSLAQRRFHEIVRKDGGLAGFAWGVESFLKIVRGG